ncbi:DoxX family protein [Streptomyces sp. NBC_01198]|uniref:DoxX family protein n=1 Tax=Streptomyces sp. NBC_01198 TaxID=2903769 RepID=UPI003FA3AF59
MTMARVPSDPAQVIVTHASFRVQLGRTSTRSLRLGDTSRIAAAPPQRAGAPGRRRLAPVVWSGHTEPGDPLAGELLQAVRRAGTEEGGAGAATQVLPRIDDTTVLPPATPTVVGPRRGQSPTGLLSGVRPARGAYDEDDEPMVRHRGGVHGDGDVHGDAYVHGDGYDDDGASGRRPRKSNGDFVKHAWYPHRRLNLGIVLLPLRIFLGFVSIYAGMGKLCDRVYFDGGERGSMVTWLASLHPWAAAEPLRTAALDHPVGAGLSIAFLQVVVGVLTICGLWQRVAAVFGAGLSIALLVTVSWRTVPVYDAPDFIYLAAWSPLVIAGAPVYSIDGKLAADAWRRLGPRVGLWDLRRYVLRRGVVLGTVIVGCTLLIGSVLGAAVRATTAPEPRPAGPTAPPVNNLPGMPLPEVPGDGRGSASATPEPTKSAKAKKKKEPDAPASTQAPTTSPGRTHTPGGTSSTGRHGSSGGTGGTGGHSAAPPPPPAAPPTHAAPPPPPPPAKPTQGAIGGLLGAPLLGSPPPLTT